MKEIPNQNHILLCVGNTAGDIGIWILPATNINPLNLPGAPLYKYCGNQVGTNCIAFTFITEDKKYPKILIVNGGDDQAISCTTVCIDVECNKRNCLDVCNVITYTEACASAIKGIAIEGDTGSGFRVYTAGYDNRLSVWALNPSQRLKYLSSTPIDVKDINTLACYPFKSQDRKGDRKVLLVAGGEGMEILSFDRNLFDAALALKKCNYLLITCGAGFSEDSGLSTYENMPDEYRELCNALRLVDNPKKFQCFWHDFSQVYANTDPHGGYKILEKWCHGKNLGNLITNGVADCDTVYSSPWWIYSSNVDGHFSRSNCFSNTICEIHGCATRFRCSQSLGICDGEKRKGALWDSWNNVAAKSFKSEQCATDTFPIDNAEDGNITCKRCKLPARPNVLLFHDTDPNMINSISQHRDRYQKWEERIENDVVHNGRRMVILELGAGLNVPAVRNETEEVLRDTLERLTASNSNGNITCIRVNPKDAGFSPQDESHQCISIYQRAEKALLMIDHILGVMS
jgi:NAD-dependent SIR2 family protein deacetylase